VSLRDGLKNIFKISIFSISVFSVYRVLWADGGENAWFFSFSGENQAFSVDFPESIG
jgi:hypothetical protein